VCLVSNVYDLSIALNLFSVATSFELAGLIKLLTFNARSFNYLEKYCMWKKVTTIKYKFDAFLNKPHVSKGSI